MRRDPQKPSGQGSFLDREDIKDLIDEALEGIKDGIPATIVAQWLMSEVPDIGRKYHTVRQGLCCIVPKKSLKNYRKENTVVKGVDKSEKVAVK